jgi:hypothetical protein
MSLGVFLFAMPPPFQDIDLEDFARLLARFPFERRVDSVHLHHSWTPRASEYRGHETLRLMWQVDRWRIGMSDIAQHVAVAPDGTIWTGRDWNSPPCSAPGHDGDGTAGPFMIMLIGNFNDDGEVLPTEQRAAAVTVAARVQRRFGLDPSSLRFHRDLEVGLTCPGTRLDLAAVLGDVAASQAALAAAAPPTKTSDDFPPFGEDAEEWYQFITICNASRDRRSGAPDGAVKPDTPGGR